MNNPIKISTIGFLFITSSIVFAQNIDSKLKSENINFKADNIKIDNATNTVFYEGNVSLKSHNISFDSADRIVYDTHNQKMEIYEPKNFKLISMKNVIIKNQNKPNLDIITFYPKEGRVEL